MSKQTKELIMVGAVTATTVLIVQTFGKRLIDRFFPEEGLLRAREVCPDVARMDIKAAEESEIK